MQQISSWKANSHLPGQKIPYFVQIYPSLEQNNKSVDKETGCEGVE
jgi:hypothetical protein